MKDPAKFDKYKKEDLAMLAEMGFIAINQLDEVSALRCFNAVAVLDHDNTVAMLGNGLVSLHKMQLEEAMKHFNRILKIESDNHLARTYIGICHVLGKKKIDEGRKWLEEAFAAAEEGPVKEMAKLWIEIIDEAAKKGDSPLKVK